MVSRRWHEMQVSFDHLPVIDESAFHIYEIEVSPLSVTKICVTKGVASFRIKFGHPPVASADKVVSEYLFAGRVNVFCGVERRSIRYQLLWNEAVSSSAPTRLAIRKKSA